MRILGSLLCLFLAVQVYAQPKDLSAIEVTLNNYLEGGTERNVDRVVSAFHTEARMQYVTDDGFQNVNAREFFGKGKSGGDPVDRKTHIISVDINGHAASAILRIDYPTFSFHDYMQLLKTDGEWLIVSKIFYRESK